MSAQNRWVVKVSGTPLEEPAAHGPLWRAIGAAREVVVVHGGGRAVDSHLARLGMETRRIAGLRCTPPEQMLEIAGVLAGRVNKTLVSSLLHAGCPAVGLSLVDGGDIRCERITHADGDLGCVGQVIAGPVSATAPASGPANSAGRLLDLLLAGGYVPVVASIGADAGGELLNVNADDAAGGLACVLDAAGVVFLSDVAGVRGDGGEIASELDAQTCEELISRGVIEGGMIAKVRAAARCAALSGRPAIIASYLRPELIERALAGEAVGTRIVATPAGDLSSAGSARELA